MKLKKKKSLLLSLSNDGIIIIAEVNRDAEDQKKKKTLWAREYYISNDCLKANLENKNFKDVTKQTDYKDGKIYALTEDLS
jgi:hypothetical protein